MQSYQYFFPDPVFAWIYYLILVGFTVVAAYVDLRRMIVPKAITLTMLASGVLFNIVRCAWLGAAVDADKAGEVLWFGAGSAWLAGLNGLLFALVGFLLGFSLFFVMWILGTCGGGDVKLFAALGAWVGWKLALLLLVATMIAVIVISLLRLAGAALTQGSAVTVSDQMRAAQKAGRKANNGAAPRRPKQRLTYSLPVALSTAVVLLVVFRMTLLPSLGDKAGLKANSSAADKTDLSSVRCFLNEGCDMIIKSILSQLWDDDTGALYATEWVIIATILVIGIIPGVIAVRNSMNKALAASAKKCCEGLDDCSSCDIESTPAPKPNHDDGSPCD